MSAPLAIQYVAAGERLELAMPAGTLAARVWHSQSGRGVSHELGSYQRQLAEGEPWPERLAQAARAADFFRLPQVIGAAWPGANTRTLSVALGDQRHQVVLHQISGLPEPLRLFEAALWEVAASLERHPLATFAAETATPPRAQRGGPLTCELETSHRGSVALDFTPGERATLRIVQGSRTFVKTEVLLRPGANQAGEVSDFRAGGLARVEGDLVAPTYAGNYEVQLWLEGPLVFEDGESRQGTLIAAPALLTVG